jgi:DNA invertase Pin-like site-specific DNA recombinase
LTDIDKGLVDSVITYKVDRLSRSLLDFAKIIETFEKRQVAFVSVTQQFNAVPRGTSLWISIPTSTPASCSS